MSSGALRNVARAAASVSPLDPVPWTVERPAVLRTVGRALARQDGMRRFWRVLHRARPLPLLAAWVSLAGLWEHRKRPAPPEVLTAAVARRRCRQRVWRQYCAGCRNVCVGHACRYGILRELVRCRAHRPRSWVLRELVRCRAHRLLRQDHTSWGPFSRTSAHGSVGPGGAVHSSSLSVARRPWSSGGRRRLT